MKYLKTLSEYFKVNETTDIKQPVSEDENPFIDDNDNTENKYLDDIEEEEKDCLK